MPRVFAFLGRLLKMSLFLILRRLVEMIVLPSFSTLTGILHLLVVILLLRSKILLIVLNPALAQV